jgi:hypothetical protein
MDRPSWWLIGKRWTISRVYEIYARLNDSRFKARKGNRRKKKLGFYSWDSIIILAIEVGLTINEFWQLTWREFLLYKTAYQNKEVREWERTRMVAYLIYKVNTSEKSPKSLKSFFPLPSDEVEDDKPKLTQEQLARTLKLYGVK